MKANNEQRTGAPGQVAEAPVYTLESHGETAYSGEALTVYGFIDGREMGEVGDISADGKLTLRLPERMPDELLTVREGMEVKGGTLTTKPELHPYRSEQDMMVLVYVSAPLWDYRTGWNYANMRHEMVPDTQGYRWVVSGGQNG